MAIEKLTIAQALNFALLIGFAAWLLTSMSDVTSRLQCVLEQIIVLKSVKGEAGRSLASFTAGFTDQTLAQFQQIIGLLNILVILPAALILVFQLLMFCCVLTKKKGSAACIKCLIFLLGIFCILGVVFYIIVGGIGLATSTPEAQAAAAVIESSCATDVPQAREDLTKTQALLDLFKGLGATGPAVEDVEYELEQWDIAVTALEAACECLTGLFAAFQALIVPGFLCAVACLLLLILDCCTCCRLGCCSAPKGSGQGKPQGNVQKVGV